MNTAERIDALLKERGLSRRQLAKKTGIPPSSLQSAMERGGNMMIETLDKIATALGVSFDYLLSGRAPSPVDEILYQMRRQKLSAADLAQRTGIAGERLLQILNKEHTIISREEETQIENALNMDKGDLVTSLMLGPPFGYGVDLVSSTISISKNYNIPFEDAEKIVDGVIADLTGELSTPEGAQIEEALLMLNAKGKQVAIERVTELTKIREYTTSDPNPDGEKK